LILNAFQRIIKFLNAFFAMNSIGDLVIQKLIEEANIGIANAFAVRTNFPVGSAVLTYGGRYYHGCNIESVISGMGTCAERCAIDNSVANGEYSFKVILIKTNLEEPVKPCGMCLQYIAEFAQIPDQDIDILMVSSKGKIERSTIFTLLPGAFGPRDLGLDLTKFQPYKR